MTHQYICTRRHTFCYRTCSYIFRLFQTAPAWGCTKIIEEYNYNIRPSMHPSIHPSIHPFIYPSTHHILSLISSRVCLPQYILRQVHSLFQNEFSRQCDLILPFSISIIPLFPLCHLVAACVFLPRLPVTSVVPCVFHSITCCRRQSLRKMWPIHLTFLPFLCECVCVCVCVLFSSSLTLCNTSFLTLSVQWIFSIFL